VNVELALPAEVLDELVERVVEVVLERLAVVVAPVSEYLTVAEAAAYLRAKPQRVYDLLSSSRLTRFKDGSRVLVARAELDAYLRGVAPLLPTGRAARMGKGRAA